MNETKYSISEIDRMRSYLRVLTRQKSAEVIEDQLRTHMLNGTPPEDLKKAADEFRDQWERDMRASGERLRQARLRSPASEPLF